MTWRSARWRPKTLPENEGDPDLKCSLEWQPRWVLQRGGTVDQGTERRRLIMAIPCDPTVTVPGSRGACTSRHNACRSRGKEVFVGRVRKSGRRTPGESGSKMEEGRAAHLRPDPCSSCRKQLWSLSDDRFPLRQAGNRSGMPSNSPVSAGEAVSGKRRRLASQACDDCRSGKARCDGEQVRAKECSGDWEGVEGIVADGMRFSPAFDAPGPVDVSCKR